MHKKLKIGATTSVLACTLGLLVGCGSSGSGNYYKVDFDAVGNTLELTTPIDTIGTQEDLVLKFKLGNECSSSNYYLPKVGDDADASYASSLKVTTGNEVLTSGSGYEYTTTEDTGVLKIAHDKYKGDIVINAKAGVVKHKINIIEMQENGSEVKHFGFNSPIESTGEIDVDDEYYYDPYNASYSTKIYSHFDYVNGESYELPQRIQVQASKNGDTKKHVLSLNEYYYQPKLYSGNNGNYYYADFAVSSNYMYDQLDIIFFGGSSEEGEDEPVIHELGSIAINTKFVDESGQPIIPAPTEDEDVFEFINTTFGNDALFYDRDKDLDVKFKISSDYLGFYNINALTASGKVNPETGTPQLIEEVDIDDEEVVTVSIDNTVFTNNNYWAVQFDLTIEKVASAHKINVAALDEEGLEVGGVISPDKRVWKATEGQYGDSIKLSIIDSRYEFGEDITIQYDNKDGDISTLTSGTDYAVNDHEIEFSEDTLKQNIRDGGEIYITADVKRIGCSITFASATETNLRLELGEGQDSFNKYDPVEFDVSVIEDYKDRYAVPESPSISVNVGTTAEPAWEEWTDYTFELNEDNTSMHITSTKGVAGDLMIYGVAQRVKCKVTVVTADGEGTYGGEYSLSTTYFAFGDETVTFDETVTLDNPSEGDGWKIVKESVKGMNLLDEGNSAGTKKEITSANYTVEAVGTTKTQLKFTGVAGEIFGKGIQGDIEITLAPQTLKHYAYAYADVGGEGRIISDPDTPDYYYIDVTVNEESASFIEQPGQAKPDMYIDIKVHDVEGTGSNVHIGVESGVPVGLRPFVQLETLGTEPADFANIYHWSPEENYYENPDHPDWLTGFKILIPHDAWVGNDKSDTDFTRGHIDIELLLIVEE